MRDALREAARAARHWRQVMLGLGVVAFDGVSATPVIYRVMLTPICLTLLLAGKTLIVGYDFVLQDLEDEES